MGCRRRKGEMKGCEAGLVQPEPSGPKRELSPLSFPFLFGMTRRSSRVVKWTELSVERGAGVREEIQISLGYLRWSHRVEDFL